ncbi:MAG: biopolymer transporter ExbD [Bacteroidetes bacterium]|nr:biopolymer transporter ExbD [Bacteroidota bacterium]
MFNKLKHRRFPEAPTGSMADIAFLLLIFFLLTTTILNEKGLLVRLPQWVDEPVNADVIDRNTLTVSLNGQNQLLVEGEKLEVSALRTFAKDFIMNPNQLPDKATSPDKAIVSLVHDRSTEYKTYLEVYNELLAAYRECRDEEAHRRYGQAFDELSIAQKRQIQQEIPLIISEAEPTDHIADVN